MSTDFASVGRLVVRVLGGPTALLELGGLRLITDPTFDSPGTYEPRPGVLLTKTEGPALGPGDIGPVDIVLLSHDHHKDNLDDAGRAFIADVPHVFTTVSGAERLGDGVTALPNWETVEVERPDGGTLRITGVPAQHGPDGTEHLTGEVTGFLLSAEDLPTVYVSGDNASVDVVRRIVERLGGADVALLFAGGARLPYLDAFLTLPSVGAADVARILGARSVVPVHFEGWEHFSDGRESLQKAFEEAGLADRLALAERGEAIAL
jgi:L-ascorbate metabolism protein UlaG (beta-lactamase superfamily)